MLVKSPRYDCGNAPGEKADICTGVLISLFMKSMFTTFCCNINRQTFIEMQLNKHLHRQKLRMPPSHLRYRNTCKILTLTDW
jgi:hypothetical protein